MGRFKMEGQIGSLLKRRRLITRLSGHAHVHTNARVTGMHGTGMGGQARYQHERHMRGYGTVPGPRLGAPCGAWDKKKSKHSFAGG